ncbi:unnamed protein product, partial [Effrenium voratum]
MARRSGTAGHGRDRWAEALAGLCEMGLARLPLAEPTKVLSACSRAGKWPVSLGLVEAMAAAGLRGDAFVNGALLSGAERGSAWPAAVALLEPWASEVPRNTVLSACEKGGRWYLALSLLEAGWGGAPSLIGSSAAMAACAKDVRQWSRSLVILEQLPNRRLWPDTVALNSALRACAVAGQLALARQLLRSFSASLQPDAVSFHTLISAAGPNLEWRCGLAILAQQRAAGLDLPPSRFAAGNASPVAVNTALAALGEAWAWSLHLLEELPTADVVTFGAVMTSLARAAQRQRALQLLDVLEERKLPTNEVIYSAAAAACEGDWQESLQLLCRGRQLRLALDAVAYGACCNCCEKSSCWEQALGVVGAAACVAHGSGPLCNAGISSCAKSGEWTQAVKALRAMVRRHLRAEGTSWNACVSACTRRWPLQLRLLELQAAEGLAVDLFGLNAAISGGADTESNQERGQLGRWRRAGQLLGQAGAGGLEPDLVSCNALALALAQHAQWQRSTAAVSAAAGAWQWRRALLAPHGGKAANGMELLMPLWYTEEVTGPRHQLALRTESDEAQVGEALQDALGACAARLAPSAAPRLVGSLRRLALSLAFSTSVVKLLLFHKLVLLTRGVAENDERFVLGGAVEIQLFKSTAPRAVRSRRHAAKAEEAGASRVAAVIGAGPAGLAAALMLAKRRWRVRLYERSANPAAYDPGKGFMYLIDGRGQHCLKSLNVDLFERLVDESVAMADAKIGVLTPEGLTERVNPIKDAARKSYWIPRHAFVGILLDEVRRCEDISLHLESGSLSLSHDAGFRIGDEEGDVSLLVGADGYRSTVRERMEERA